MAVEKWQRAIISMFIEETKASVEVEEKTKKTTNKQFIISWNKIARKQLKLK